MNTPTLLALAGIPWLTLVAAWAIWNQHRHRRVRTHAETIDRYTTIIVTLTADTDRAARAFEDAARAFDDHCTERRYRTAVNRLLDDTLGPQ